MTGRGAAIAALLVIGGCDEARVAAPVCHAPDLAIRPTASAYASAREAADHCVKAAAFTLTLAGGLLAGIPAQALSRCQAQEEAFLKSVAEGGRTWRAFQRRQVRADLTHLASLTSVQARSIGCGRRPGEGPETLLTSDNPS